MRLVDNARFDDSNILAHNARVTNEKGLLELPQQGFMTGKRTTFAQQITVQKRVIRLA